MHPELYQPREVDTNQSQKVEIIKHLKRGNRVLVKPPEIISNGKGILYKRGEMLGKGGFGTVWEVTYVDPMTKRTKIAACKTIALQGLEQKHLTKLEQELIIHTQLSQIDECPVVKVLEHFNDDQCVYIIQEKLGLSLQKVINKQGCLNENDIRYWGRQMISRLNFLHNNLIMHRDIKPSNILLTPQKNIKYCDFGMAVQLKDKGEEKKNCCGTPNYMAPEIVKKKAYTLSVDIWSLGVCFYTMLVGKAPFESKSGPDKTAKNILRGVGNIQYPSNIYPPLLMDLIDSILVSRKSRPSLTSLIRHPFFIQQVPKISLSAKMSSVNPNLSVTPSAKAEKNPYSHEVHKKSVQQTEHTIELNTALHSVTTDFTSIKPAEEPLCGHNSKKDFSLEIASSNTQKHPQSLEDSKTKANSTITTTTMQFAKGYENLPGQHVLLWAHHEAKFGFSYLLSSGIMGILFNDNSKMLAFLHGEAGIFIDRIESKEYNGGRKRSHDAQPMRFNFKNPMSQLQEKVSCVIYARNQFKHLSTTVFPHDVSLTNDTYADLEQCNYVKSYVRTNRAMVFRLAKSIVQTNFSDHTKLIWDVGSKKIGYLNKDRVPMVLEQSQLVKTKHSEIFKRLKYSKAIIQSLVSQPK
eukprot:TRINITY_DN2582_c0_g1_i2.p1 TRINITY_DN2582_c0_g1~~TRINITY_DN2582_c0_g1_i2.p1  ORF type:complete len:634 (+),score=138.08 TRINITY_DN2582_c0_g1_i2:158-2059(+)